MVRRLPSGRWIAEDEALKPQTDRARRRCDAEATLAAWSAATGAEIVVLRVPGIYAPTRLPVDRVRGALERLVAVAHHLGPWGVDHLQAVQGPLGPQLLDDPDPDVAQTAAATLDRDADLLTRVNGYFVLAPGWHEDDGVTQPPPDPCGADRRRSRALDRRRDSGRFIRPQGRIFARPAGLDLWTQLTKRSVS